MFHSCCRNVMMLLWLVMASALMWPLSLHATDWYVAPTGSPECSGLNWVSALDCLQDALDRSVSGDRIFVAEGVYMPKKCSGDAIVPHASFQLKDGVSLFGGMAGYESVAEFLSMPSYTVFILDKRPTHDRDRNGIIEAWEYLHETVLTLPPGCSGPVLECGGTTFGKRTLVSGFTIRGGNALGLAGESANPGKGGGASVSGTVEFQCCLFEDNYAIDGGAIHSDGEAIITRSRFIRNNAAGGGGAICMIGDGGQVRACVFSDNGDEQSCISGGGAIYLGGAAHVNFCTAVGNASFGVGSAIMVAGTGARIRNSLIWGNFGHPQELWCGNGNEVERCAVTSGGCAGVVSEGCFPLARDNAGPNGVDVNDNDAGLYYPCMNDVPLGNFSLGRGSYLIQRCDRERLPWQHMSEQDVEMAYSEYAFDMYSFGCEPGYDARPGALRDIKDWNGHFFIFGKRKCPLIAVGAYDTFNGYNGDGVVPGNMAIHASLDRELYYGERARIRLVRDPHQLATYEFTVDRPEILAIEGGEARALSVGKCIVTVTATPVASSREDCIEEFSPVTREFEVTVRPRPLHILIDDQTWDDSGMPRPSLTWRLLSGKLNDGDRIVGQPDCAIGNFPAEAPSQCPILPGTLSVEPFAAAGNYEIVFTNGVLKCLDSREMAILSDVEMIYNGREASPECAWPSGRPVALSWSHLRDGESDSVAGLPVYPGSYTVMAENASGGAASCRVVIHKAPLKCTAADKYRAVGAANPEFTCIWEGLVGNDTVGSLEELPVASTSAGLGSPASARGYPISLSGGHDYRYEISTFDGMLYVTGRAAQIEAASAEGAVYGTRLSEIWICAYSVDPDSGDFVSGEFLWDEPGAMLEAGEHLCSWTFIPDDNYTYGCSSGSSVVSITCRPLTVGARSAGKEYGEPDPELHFGILQGSLASGDRLDGEVRRDAGESLGSYRMSVGDLRIVNAAGRDVTRNYAMLRKDGQFTIARRRLAIAIDSLSKEVGGDDPAFTWRVAAGALLPGDQAQLELIREEGEEPGRYAITPAAAVLPDCYEATVEPGQLVIYVPGLRLMVDPETGLELLEVGEIVYGMRLDGARQLIGQVCYFDPAAGGEITVDGHFEWIRDGERPDAGEYDLSWIFVPDDEMLAWEESLCGEMRVQIQKAVLKAKVTPLPQPVPYRVEGDFSNCKVSFLSGLVNDDNEFLVQSFGSAKVRRPPIDAKPGKYPMNIELYGRSNYRVEVDGGAMFVISRAVPVLDGVRDVTGKPFIYGQPLESRKLVADNVRGAVGEPVEGTVVFDAPRRCPSAGRVVAGWTFVPSMGDCYESVRGSIALEVQPAELTVTAVDAERQVGQANPAFQLSFSGFVRGENVSVLRELPQASCSADESSPIGIYEVVISGGLADNYVFKYRNSSLRVKGSSVQVAPGTQVSALGSITYGQPLRGCPLYGAFTDVDSGEVVTGVLRWEDPDAILPAGTHAQKWVFTAAGKGGGTASGIVTLQVMPAVLQCSLPKASYEAVYGDELYAVDALTVSGLVNGDDMSAIEELPVAASTRNPRSPVGEYPMTIFGGRARNYRFESAVTSKLIQARRRIPVAIESRSTHAYVYVDESDDPLEIAGCNVRITLLPGDRYSGMPSREPGTAAGRYRYTLGTLDAGPNYELYFMTPIYYVISKYSHRGGGVLGRSLYGPTLQEMLSELPPPTYGNDKEGTAGKYQFEMPSDIDTGIPLLPGKYNIPFTYVPEDLDVYEIGRGTAEVVITSRKANFSLQLNCEAVYGDNIPSMYSIGSQPVDGATRLAAATVKPGGLQGEDTVVLRYDIPAKLDVGKHTIKASGMELRLPDGRVFSPDDSNSPYKCNGTDLVLTVTPKMLTPVLREQGNLPKDYDGNLHFTCLESELVHDDEPFVQETRSYRSKTRTDGFCEVTLSSDKTGNGNYVWDTSVRMQYRHGMEAVVIAPAGMAEAVEGACTVVARDLADGSRFEIDLPFGINQYSRLSDAVENLLDDHPVYLCAGGDYESGYGLEIKKDVNLIGVRLVSVKAAGGQETLFPQDEELAMPTIKSRIKVTAARRFAMSRIAMGQRGSDGWLFGTSQRNWLTVDAVGASVALDGCQFHGGDPIVISALHDLAMRNCLVDFIGKGLSWTAIGGDTWEGNSNPAGMQLQNNRFTFSASSAGASAQSQYRYLYGNRGGSASQISIFGNSFDGVAVDGEIGEEQLSAIHSHLEPGAGGYVPAP